MRLISILIFCCLFSLFPIYGSYFRNYQVENGLSHNSIWTVMQDSDGFMWFGTIDGLNRFDGKNFKIYRKQQGDSLSIGHNFIHCIKEDSQKRILVGTRNGVYLYNKTHDNFKHIPIEKNDKKDINVNDIMEDANGNIWVACHGEGLYRLNSQLVTEKHYKLEDNPANFIWTIITDHNGNLWLGTAGKGMVHFDPRNERFTPIVNRKGLDIEKQSIYSIYCDDDNNLWIGTSTNGLFKYNNISGEVSHYLQNTGSVKAITKYSDQELIMGSDKGLVIFDAKLETYKIIKENDAYDDTPDNSIFCITKDKEGSFWIGTYFGGVNYISPSINKFSYSNIFFEKASRKYIISGIVEEGNGNILIATHNNNIIYRFNPDKNKMGEAFRMDYHNIQGMLRNQDKLYVSIYGRDVNVFSLQSGRIIEKINIKTIEGKSIFAPSKGGVLFALEEGGCAYKDPAGELKRLKPLSGIAIVDIAEDSTGTIWFATYTYGLFCWKSDGTWENFSNKSNKKLSLISNDLSCIHCSSSNQLWIGTKSEGLILYNALNGEIEKVLNEKSGMPSNYIYSILNDKDGDLWVSTRKGIVKISSGSFDIKAFGYIGKEMQYNSKCALTSSDNRLYFGGTNGFILLNPKELNLNNCIPKVVLTGFRIFNDEVFPGGESSPLKYSLEVTKEIVLKHDQSNFSFEFASLSYIFPESNSFAYKLDGFDKNWNYVSGKTAQYMNIPPGEYIFRIKGTNNDGIWSQETSLNIRIKPPFWLESYMILLYFILFIGIVIYSVLQYHKYINKKNLEKQYKYQITKEKEIYESKINFFTNIAHEIRTPLSLITAPLENIINSEDTNEKVKKNLNLIKRNTNRLLDLVNQLLDFRKIENDMFLLNLRYQNIVKIVKKVYDQHYQDMKIHHIEMNLDVQENNILSYVDSEALYKIISNLISNAVKFTKDKINVRLTTRGEILYLSVEDNGNGIKADYLEKIFEPFYQVEGSDNYTKQGSGLGLSLSQSLAKKLGGNISVQSEYGKASIFTLELPILKTEKLPVTHEEIIDKTAYSTETTEPEYEHTVLIVEDNEELRNFMNDCLAGQYNVFEAENGIEALKILENSNVDIIISDIVMPKMDGLDLCNEVKSNAAYSHLPFILLSAKTDTSTKIEGLKKGADVYMEKPFSLEQLKAQISSIVENRTKLRKSFVKSPLQYFKRNNTENNESSEFVKKLNAFIIDNMSDENFSIDSLSSEFAISRTNFQKKIKNITGLTPNDYIKLIRLNKSAELLSTGKYRINEVCIIVGFNTPSYFSKCFYEHFGKLPKDFVGNESI